MLRKISLFITIIVFSSGIALAEDAMDKLMKDSPALKGANINIKSMNSTSYGLMEVITGKGDIFYVSQDLKYAFVGNVVELSSGRNLTMEKLKETKKQSEPASIGSLPAGNAIVEGAGSREIAVFTDPTCPHCITLDGQLRKIPDLTVKKYLLPISQAGYQASLAVCKQKLQGKDCDTILKENKMIATRLGIDGTPSIMFSNGYLHVGGMSVQEIERQLEAK